MDKEEIIAYVQEADKSLLHFGLAFTPEALYDPISVDIHLPMLRLIDQPVLHLPNPEDRRKREAAPRGIGKSTWGNTINLLRRTTLKRSRYVLLGSNTLEQACEHLKAFKQQIETNPRIYECFGDLSGKVWREEEVVLANGVKVRAVGWGQQVRGRREGFQRPDYFLGDDLESLESVGSETSLNRMRLWLNTDVRNSLDRHRAEELILGTILSDNSILQEELDSSTGFGIRLELFDENYKSNWPEVYPDSRIEAMRKDAEERGQLDGLWMDYRNIAISVENRKFDRSWFKTWSPDFDWSSIPRFIIVDPAKTKRLTSDYSAVHVVGLPSSGDVFDLDYDFDRKVNEALYEQIYRFAVQYNVNTVYVETNGIDDFITEPLFKYLRRRGKPCQVIGMHATGAKEDRIMAMIPAYKMGQVYHSPFKNAELQDQLIKFPRSKFDDIMDCFSYFVYIQTKRWLGRSGGKKSYQGDTNKLHKAMRGI